jgi:hypothetical protein
MRRQVSGTARAKSCCALLAAAIRTSAKAGASSPSKPTTVEFRVRGLVSFVAAKAYEIPIGLAACCEKCIGCKRQCMK